MNNKKLLKILVEEHCDGLMELFEDCKGFIRVDGDNPIAELYSKEYEYFEDDDCYHIPFCIVSCNTGSKWLSISSKVNNKSSFGIKSIDKIGDILILKDRIPCERVEGVSERFLNCVTNVISI